MPAGVYPVLEHNTTLSSTGWQAVPRATATLDGPDLLFTPASTLTQGGQGFFRLRLEVVP
jgi:hypothetical protein